MRGGEKRLFAMQDRRVGALAVVVKVDLSGPHVEFDARRQSRVGIGLEVGIGEVRDLSRKAMQLDEIGVFNLSQISASAPFVDPQQRPELLQGRPMNVQRIGEQFSQRRIPTRLVDGVGIPGPKQQFIRLISYLFVRAEELLDVREHLQRQCRITFSAAPASQNQRWHSILNEISDGSDSVKTLR